LVGSLKESLELECEIKEQGAWVSYQKGTLESIRPLSELIASSGFSDGCAMLCGTLPAIGGVRAANDYRMKFIDPILKRELHMEYSVNQLPSVA